MSNLNLSFSDIPHSRINMLTGEKVLISPHRSKRPWQGQIEDLPADNRPAYDPKCYLCAGNVRADGAINPPYKESFVFVNDFSALLPDVASGTENEEGLLVAEAERGICKVISFTPRHDLTLPEMDISSIKAVVDVWQSEFDTLSQEEWIRYIQIFENKGSIMGCSNPHPHGQIWAQGSLPVEIRKETEQQRLYFEKNGVSLLGNYLQLELRKKERILINNQHFVALVPYWASWPYETMIISKRHIQSIAEFTEEEKLDLATTLQELTIRYDNLFKTSFPYSAGMHQAPVNSGDYPEWHWHMHFYPPLLRSATVKKFMVGYELLANPQRDITPEYAAEKLRELSDIHYKQQSN
ncbi:UDP-glucose--hexose-1-phosphate uridylyltransferase [Sphingobacterium spiritivorum]|nr:UDP-glucose--hexose-1-phosphate uridylyltransferase [Sphingobacterium spiritivorum]QQT37622.1 UDP-glucose--hexose-1-phosphate uridylyltransferase [Sphingobacterium spiritivorum]WQD34420.1 UDP-glucose--hexose-1-phosphate uridylyltransferase [Sphingobacterium spiritivorum]SUI97384.1 Galactose-1-phosphate uridylyltransferase [Sphingobacterium spiritivorum]